MPKLVTNEITGQKGWKAEDGSVFPITEPEQETAEFADNLDMLLGIYKESGMDAFEVAKNAFDEYRLGAEVMAGRSRDSALAEYNANQAMLEPLRERSPVSTFAAEYAPEVALALADKGRSLMASVGIGGAEGLRFQPEAADQARTGAISAGFAGAFPMVSRIWDMAGGLAREFRNEAANRALDQGLSVTPGMADPDSIWKRVDQLGENMPLSNAMSTPPAQTNQTILNRSANRAIGELGDTVTSANRRAASERINGTYKVLAERLGKKIQLPPGLADNVRAYFRKLNKMNELDAFGGLAKDGDGVLTGDELLSVHRMMVRQADLAANNDAVEPIAIARGILDPLDEIIEGGLGKELTESWRTVREQGRFLNLLNEGKSVTGGNVNPDTLRTRTQRNMPEVVNMGKGERLYTDAGRDLVEQVDILADPAMKTGKDSGTPGRLANVVGAVASVDALTGGTAGLLASGAMLGNSALQAGTRAIGAPLADFGLMAKNKPVPLLARTGQMLDEVLYPFVGSEDEREQ